MSSFATHIMGSDISYKCLGNNKYKVVLKVYRDCNGIVMLKSLPVSTKCDNNSLQKNIQVIAVSVKDITGINPPNVKTQCDSGSFMYGVEEHTYEGVVDLATLNCCEITISWSICCRNDNITTGAANANFYSEAILNKCLEKCNSSPVFTTPATAFVCAGNNFVFNNGASDTIDNDLLTYRLVDPLSNSNKTINYTGGYSSQMPLQFLDYPNVNSPKPKGFHFDATTGDITFQPTMVNQVSVLVIEVTEWRYIKGAYVEIGKVRRDIQIIVISCPKNAIPSIEAEGDTVCIGEEVCIYVGSYDMDTEDSVRLFWNNSIKGAKFKLLKSTDPKKDSAIICWTPKEGDNRQAPYNFIVGAEDNAKPIIGRIIKAIQVFVKPFTIPTIISNDEEQCLETQNFTFINASQRKAGEKYYWEFPNGDTFNTNKVDNYTFSQGVGSYTIKMSLIDDKGCIASTHTKIQIKPHPEIEISKTGFRNEFCASEIPYSLLPLPGDAFFSGDNIVNGNSFKAVNIGVQNINYFISENGCSSDTILPLEVFKLPKSGFIINDTVQCFDNHNFDFINTSSANSGRIDSSFWFLPESSQRIQSMDMYGVTFSKPGIFPIKLVVQTNKGCLDTAVNNIVTTSNPNADFFGLKEQHCINGEGSVLLARQEGGIFVGNQIEGNKFIPKQKGKTKVTYVIEVDGCKVSKTIETNVRPAPEFDFRGLFNCYKQPITLDAKFPNSTYLWSDGSTNATFTIKQTGKYWVTLYNICDTITQEIQVNDCFYAAYPNAFSPNNDGVNDIFMPFVENAEKIKMTIFNRWGEELFTTTEFNKGWDGTYKNTPVTEGVYYFVTEIRYYDEHHILRTEHFKNTITLIR